MGDEQPGGIFRALLCHPAEDRERGDRPDFIQVTEPERGYDRLAHFGRATDRIVDSVEPRDLADK